MLDKERIKLVGDSHWWRWVLWLSWVRWCRWLNRKAHPAYESTFSCGTGGGKEPNGSPADPGSWGSWQEVMVCVCVRDDGRISGWRGCTRDWSVSGFCMWKWLTTNTFDCMLTARPLTGITVCCIVFCYVFLFMVALWNSADHHIFALWFLLLSIYLSFFLA